MNTSTIELQVKAERVEVDEETLTVTLEDGRTVGVPLAWYPRLLHGTPTQRRRWRLIGRGEGIHWTDLDEDISVEGLVKGDKSQESQASFARWLQSRPHSISAHAATVAEGRAEYKTAILPPLKKEGCRRKKV